MAVCVFFLSFTHVSEDNQRSLILARSLSHPPFHFHINVQVCKLTSDKYIYIYISPRARSNANIKRKLIGKSFKGTILLFIITSQGTRVQHNKMICRVHTIVCMVKVTGHNNKVAINIHNHRPIIISLEKSVHHDKTMCHISPRLRSQATLL